MNQDQNNSPNLNNYILQDKIGSGSFGKVYRVKSKSTNLIYAAKISKEYLDKRFNEHVTNIYGEVNIISKLKHPSVLKFILFSHFNFTNKPKPVIITEYASNGSLLKMIKHDHDNPNNQFLDDTRKIIIIYGIVSAMSYLHFHDIIHRDLKSDNILLDEYFLKWLILVSLNHI